MDFYLKKSERKYNNRIREFSAHLMSNSKWLKLFSTLSSVHDKIIDCIVIDIFSLKKSKSLKIPPINNFDTIFHSKGIKDVLLGGPLSFKEIRFIDLIIADNELKEISTLLNSVGEFDIEYIENRLRIYGYK